jgi:hypothetical protein
MELVTGTLIGDGEGEGFGIALSDGCGGRAYLVRYPDPQYSHVVILLNHRGEVFHGRLHENEGFKVFSCLEWKFLHLLLYPCDVFNC